MEAAGFLCGVGDGVGEVWKAGGGRDAEGGVPYNWFFLGAICGEFFKPVPSLIYKNPIPYRPEMFCRLNLYGGDMVWDFCS